MFNCGNYIEYNHWSIYFIIFLWPYYFIGIEPYWYRTLLIHWYKIKQRFFLLRKTILYSSCQMLLGIMMTKSGFDVVEGEDGLGFWRGTLPTIDNCLSQNNSMSGYVFFFWNGTLAIPFHLFPLHLSSQIFCGSLWTAKRSLYYTWKLQAEPTAWGGVQIQ